ncbi:MAG TPA: hypothetical protein VKD26_09775 [Streptosporangiaceae bacterium]|nr:hypothetical protein [Streptosporangiaceae bacterium]
MSSTGGAGAATAAASVPGAIRAAVRDTMSRASYIPGPLRGMTPTAAALPTHPGEVP